MLATAGTPADLHGSDWLFELKWDGIRALVVADGEKIRLLSRNGNDMSASYPELTDRSCWPPQDFIADGEIIAVGPPRQARLRAPPGKDETDQAGRREKGPRRHPGTADALRPAGRRRAMTCAGSRSCNGGNASRTSTARRTARWSCPRRWTSAWTTSWKAPANLALEGVMAKRADSRYVSGQRSRSVDQAQDRADPGSGGGRLAARQGRTVQHRGLTAAGHTGGQEAPVCGPRGQRLQHARTQGTAANHGRAGAQELAVR